MEYHVLGICDYLLNKNRAHCTIAELFKLPEAEGHSTGTRRPNLEAFNQNHNSNFMFVHIFILTVSYHHRSSKTSSHYLIQAQIFRTQYSSITPSYLPPSAPASSSSSSSHALCSSPERSTATDFLLRMHRAPTTKAPISSAIPASVPTTTPAISLGYSVGPPTISKLFDRSAYPVFSGMLMFCLTSQPEIQRL